MRGVVTKISLGWNLTKCLRIAPKKLAKVDFLPSTPVGDGVLAVVPLLMPRSPIDKVLILKQMIIVQFTNK